MSGVAVRARWAGRGVLLLVVVILALNAVWIARYYPVLRPMTAGDLAPDFSLPRIDHEGGPTGEGVTLSGLRGQVVVLDFWAAWCGPCRQAMPLLEQIYRSQREHGLALVSIKTDGNAMGQAAEAIGHTSFPIVVDDDSASARYRVTNLPHVVILDRRGVVRFVHRGGIEHGQLKREVESLLDEPER